MSFFDIFRISTIKKENENLKNQVDDLSNKLNELGALDYYKIKEKTESMNAEFEKKIAAMETEINTKISAGDEKIKIQLEQGNKEIASNNEIISKQRDELEELADKTQKLAKQLSTQNKKLARSKELYQSIEYAMNNFFISDVEYTNCKLSKGDYAELDLVSPSVILKLHCMDVKDLRKAYRDNEKNINQILEQYSSRYTTKANKSIYSLMVIALRAELQNVLFNLKYEKIDISIEEIKTISAKYLSIAGQGNQSIAGTLTKFIGEIEYLFINAVKIEYNYYIKKEKARQEQLAIREQMRQEAEERKALEIEKKKIEKEETKYQAEISKLQEALSSNTNSDDVKKLEARILELQNQLSDVILKKEEISNLQNGKAGNVYIISNLGSFGEDVFKIGMTRRLDPQDRVNELGSASVPFKFDVHSFIFSEDAVGLESKLHELLNNKRLNKVNLRKEFFRTSVDELEQIVTEIEPTAEFNRTMIAEEFNQSLAVNEVYSNEYSFENEDDEDE
ncbi:GIY-YIG nuclease family protein [Novisyntrophococcus fermenticellae]|uniref:GIY-YIG nuclease family protein n=1 Tax=Novisyntrophococcus fermenticellae TaxID=2068655 RepID=UPI001E3CDABB|nr:GIY-YIG nuclease family protein [Novisyntrophococcus fermenticellae]